MRFHFPIHFTVFYRSTEPYFTSASCIRRNQMRLNQIGTENLLYLRNKSLRARFLAHKTRTMEGEKKNKAQIKIRDKKNGIEKIGVGLFMCGRMQITQYFGHDFNPMIPLALFL